MLEKVLCGKLVSRNTYQKVAGHQAHSSRLINRNAHLGAKGLAALVTVPNRVSVACVARGVRNEAFKSLDEGNGVVVDFWRATDGLECAALDVCGTGAVA